MNPPIPENRCPECGAPLTPGATLGLCARCLLAGAAEPTEHGAPRSAPPSLAEVAAAFPQLEVVEMIGHGGMGAVFKVRQPKLNRCAALKLLPQSLAADVAFAGRFEREAQLLARLSHPNITAVYDYGQAGGFFFLLMEFVDGVNLRQAMRASRFTPAQALGIVPKICEALQYAHDEGVLHRDIKPENILLDAKGRVKLADFGIAKLTTEPDPGSVDSGAKDPALTQIGAALGTPSYMAPEQRDTPGDVDHRADIYSLGVVFYELLTGELPVGKFAPPSALSAADPRVDAIVQQALQKEREDRQHSAAEMKTQVETAITSPSTGGGAHQKSRGWSPLFFPLLAFGAVSLGLAGFMAWSYPQLPERMASHFDADGRVNGWMARSQYLLLLCGMAAFLTAVFCLVAQLAKRFPALVKIPNRDYWFAPERRTETADLLLGQMLWLAVLSMLFFAGLHALTLRANLARQPALPSGALLGLVIVFFIALLTWVAGFLNRFADTAQTVAAPAKGRTVTALITCVLLGSGVWIFTDAWRSAPSPPPTIPSERGPARAEPFSDLERVFTDYEQLLTALREATFELDLADFAEGTETERREHRAGIEAKCRALAEQTARLREQILALGRRAAEPRER